ncbi:MAG TPA: AAA family ATPase [Methylomirabilota bacterium]|jgi:class 3 adenylate cyclase/tetratricopeptide (TPR) repeat protein
MPSARCGHDVPADAQFCPECGSRLALTCAACGTDNAPTHKFCKQCGRPLDAAAPAPPEAPDPVRFSSPQSYTPRHLAEKILTSKSALEGERKQVTVLFCDIANSTSLAAELGDEAMHGVLERFFELALAEVHHYEGTVNQFLGDGFMALFGAPIAHEDDARRAVLAALGILRRLREPVSGATGVLAALTVRMGLNSGFVVVGRIGDNLRMDYTAVGDTTNLAARLQQAAEAGTVLMSEATLRLVQGAVRAERVGPFPVKGKAEPVIAHRLLGLAPRRSALDERPERRFIDFVGREREIGVLGDVFAQVASGRGQVIGVVGEPGMGKSRLLYEFRRSLSRRPVTVLEGRCLSYGGSIPYLPIVEILRNNSGILDSDAPDIVADRVAAALREVGMAPADSAMYLLHLLGVKEQALESLSPETIKARTFETLRQLSLKGSRRRPLVFIVEDVHWIDQTSEEYLASLVESFTAAPILLMTTYRPGYRPPWSDRSYATQITLRPLARQDSLAVVQSARQAGRLSGDLSERILSRAEGNPFFLEELALAVSDERGDDHAIPDTVQGVLTARIDRLSEETKRLVRTAAVLGREFPLKLLERIWDGPGALQPHLLELKRLEFVYEQAGAEEPIYVFKHALTQDVAYEGLLSHRRQALHAAAAQALEELYPGRLDEVEGALAYHYARSEVADKAVTYLVRLADKAARVYANSDALTHLREALVHVARLPDGRARDRRLIEIALRQGFSLYFLGRFVDSVARLLEHRERLDRVGDPTLAGPYYFWLAHMYTRLGDQQRVKEVAERAIEEASRCGDDATLGKAHGALALDGHWSGRTAEAIAHGREAVARLTGSTTQQWWLGMAHFYVAINYLLVGRFAETIESARSAHDVGEAISDMRLQCYAAFTVGWAAASRGEWAEAIEACERSRKLATDRVSGAYAAGFLGYAHIERGDAETALPLLEHVVRELEQFGFPQWHGLWTSALAEARRVSGDTAAALETARRGVAITTGCKYWYGVGYGQRVLGRIALDARRFDEAAAHFDDALRTFVSVGVVFEAARTRLELATLAAGRGDRDTARVHVDAALAVLRDLDAPVYLERAQRAASELGAI